MGVVELDGHLVGECRPVVAGAAEAADGIGHGAGDEKILLEETQALALGGGIIRIEHAGEGFRGERLGEGSHEVAAAELLEIEIIRSGGGPQAQGVDRFASIADDRPVVRDAEQCGRAAADHLQFAAADFKRAADFHLDALVGAGDFPWVRAGQPVIGLFMLPAVMDILAEDTIFISQSAAHARNGERGHGVEEASGEASEPAISQACVGFLLDHIQGVEVVAEAELGHHRVEQQVGDVVGQRAPHQEFKRDVIDALHVLLLVGLAGEQPALRKEIAHGAGGRLELVAGRGVFERHHAVEGEVALVEGVVCACERHRPAVEAGEQLVGSHGGRGPFPDVWENLSPR